MRIGYVVQGSTDRAALTGFKQRWCPSAELQLLHFRGSKARYRDYPSIFKEAALKGIDIVVILTDSDVREWREIYQEERAHVPDAGVHITLIGVAERNIECWLCADWDYASRFLGCSPKELAIDDPKGIFESLLGITRFDKKETEIASMVTKAPSLKNWIRNSKSFKAFYDDARRMAVSRGCRIPNEMGV